MKEKLRKEKIRYSSLSHNTSNEIIGRFKSAEVRDNAISELRSEYPQLSFLAPEEKASVAGTFKLIPSTTPSDNAGFNAINSS